MTTPGWQTISTTFMKNDKPYGGGDSRIKGNEVISLKLARPELRFRAVDLDKGYNEAQAVPEEAWMNNANERLNRSTVSFFRGTIDGGMTRHFQQSGQNAAWWYSKDWSTQYVSTDWMDYKRAEHEKESAPHITKLWRSSDGGKSWTQLKWPEDQNIGQLLFVDSERGYAVGWGPRIWRTENGGNSWQKIDVPHLATENEKSRKTFNGVDLGSDGTLRVAYYLEAMGKTPAESVVDRLKWGRDAFEREVALPDQVIAYLQSEQVEPDARYAIYAVSRIGSPQNYKDPNDKGHRIGAISTWSNQNQPVIEQRHTFDQRLTLDGFSVGRLGVLLVYASNATGEGAPHDLTLASRDYGKSWEETNDGTTQGVYFDPTTNTQYGLYTYTLKKRTW